MNGSERIAAERQRQIDVESYGAEHDDAETGLLAAAHAFFVWAENQIGGEDPITVYGRLPDWWPWEPRDWKPSPDPIRNLEIAGALIAAEIDRLLRASCDTTTKEDGA